MKKLKKRSQMSKEVLLELIEKCEGDLDFLILLLEDWFNGEGQ